MKTKLFLALFFLVYTFQLSAQSSDCATTVFDECGITWEDREMGYNLVSKNTILSYDIDNDNILENIVSGGHFTGNSSWSILKYHQLTNEYKKVHQGPLYDEKIYGMNIFDLFGNGQNQLVLWFDRSISIIDLGTLEEIKKIKFSESINDIAFGDINNNGKENLVISTYSGFRILNIEDFSIDLFTNLSVFNFDIGNVDDDSATEVVLWNGKVLEFEPTGNFNEENDIELPFSETNKIELELVDIDTDSKKEVIFFSKKDGTVVYEIQTSTLLHTFDKSLTHKLYDLNEDGVNELIISDYPAGTRAYSLIDGNNLWTIENSYNSKSVRLELGDFDGDSKLEMISRIVDNPEKYQFIVHDVNSKNIEWKSINKKGLCYALEIADIDKDNKKEIVTISKDGYLLIYNAQTKKLEYQSDEQLIKWSENGVYNLEIFDYKNDGDLDIIVAGEIGYEGHIWVIDGSTKTIEKNHLYPKYGADKVKGFQTLSIADIDLDGKTEFICGTKSQVYVIDSETFDIEFASNESSNYSDDVGILIGNVDDDPEDEIVFCSRDILIYNLPNYEMHQSNTNFFYTAFKLFDWDNDGKNEIIAGTSTGFLHVLDGENLSILESYQAYYGTIKGIEFNNQDPSKMQFLTLVYDNELVTISKQGSILNIDKYIMDMGSFDGMKSMNTEGIYPSFIIGTAYGIIEYDTKCMNYLDLNYQTFPPCTGDLNASILLDVFGMDTLPIHYSWEREEDGAMGNGTANQSQISIDNLGVGTYHITVSTDAYEAYCQDNIIIENIDGSIFEITEIKSINSTNEMDNGSIIVKFNGGKAPYSISWNGAQSGTISNINFKKIKIFDLPPGEYMIELSDAESQSRIVNTTLLDEIVPFYPCEQPLDIVILNDVSGSVDGKEYQESKTFFVDFLKEANIGLSADESRASIVEWSSSGQQEIRIPFTGDMINLEAYENYSRAFSDGTSPIPALEFGSKYIEDIGREGVDKVIVLSTDGYMSESLIELADVIKAKGFHIVTIAFDGAYSDEGIRDILRKVASVDLLAPGAPAYSQLDKDLADKIVNLYLCPLDPGSSSTVYFNRDGAIDIISVENECPVQDFVEVTFEVSASRELSIPSGTKVMFYHNNPKLFGATPILNFNIPCAIEIGTSETYTVQLPIDGATNLFALLNDDGLMKPPLKFPLTDIKEIAYSNNIDSVKICLSDIPTVQAFKYTTTPAPICDSLLMYTIDVCNISSSDAFDVQVSDFPPEGSVLKNKSVNTNGCSQDNGSTFDIPAGCCVSLSLSYDASNVPSGYYGVQHVELDGPDNQEYINYDGNLSSLEDVVVEEGVIDCDSPNIYFEKAVNKTEICEDRFLTYTFTITNESNATIQGVQFFDELPAPMEWVYKPYALTNMSISTTELNGKQIASFMINEIAPKSTATFQIDAYTGDWSTDGSFLNKASLENVPDFENGGIQSLESNTVSTFVKTNVEIPEMDTIFVQSNEEVIDLLISVSGSGTFQWTTDGDGLFNDSSSPLTQYILGDLDKQDSLITLFLSGKSDCEEIGKELIIIRNPCAFASITSENTLISCYNESTLLDATSSQLKSTDIYGWYDDSNALLSDNLQFEVFEGGTFTFKIIDTISQCTVYQDIVIEDIRNTPNAKIQSTDQILTCKKSSLKFWINPEENAIYSWKLDNEDEVNSEDITIQQKGNLVLSVIDTVTGCTNSKAIDIQIDTLPPNIELATPDVLNCSSDFVQIDASQSDEGNNKWLDSSDTEIGLNEKYIMVSKSGWYYFELEDIQNGCQSVDSIQVFEDFEVASIELDEAFYLGCDESYNQVEAKISSSQVYYAEWQFENEFYSSEPDPTFTKAGTYYLKVTNNQSSCSTVDSILVYPAKEIENVITSEMNALCYGESNGSIHILKIEGGTPIFQYYLNNELQEDGEFDNLSSGVFNIKLIDSKGCSYDTNITLTDPSPLLSTNGPIEHTIKKGKNIEIHIETNIDTADILSVEWTPLVNCEDCLSYTLENISEDRVYSITVTDINGCKESIEIRIYVDDNFEVYLPNIININSTENNVFFPQSTQNSDMLVQEMAIYDRWGNLVYQKENFSVNDKQFGWNGTFNNKEVNSGVYVYILRMKQGERTFQLVGDITVIK